MQFIETGVEVLRPLHSRPMMNPSPTKVRRKLFADSSPLNYKIINDTARILNSDYERFKAKYNYDFDANKALPGRWDWLTVNSENAPSFYSKPYPAKKPESLKSHHMACVKTRDQNYNLYRNGHFMSLATPCTGNEQKTTSTSTIHPVLPETPCKGTTLSYRSSSGTTKRKMTQTDDDAVSDFNEVKGDDNHILPNPSSSPLRSHSPSETVPSTQLSSQSQDSVGHNLQNIPRTTTTDNQSSSQTIIQTSLLAQQEKQTRQTNITEYMKSQKNPTEPIAKHA